MTKRNKIIYWIFTAWMCLGMVSSGIVQLLGVREEVDLFNQLHYPLYLMTIIGVWKMLGVVAVLLPRLPLLKEWAYAGFFFTMSGAFVSHIVMHSPGKEVFPSVLLMVLIAISWYFRPADRKFTAVA